MDKTSAIQRNSRISIPVDQDHSHLVKFGPDDQDCQAILTFLYKAAKKIHGPAANHEIFALDSDEDGFNEVAGEAMLRSLDLDGVGLRFEEIEAHYSSTLEWIYENKDLGFTEWLQGDQRLYWISGKPGSGKSTLMKFIRKDPRTYYPFDEDPPERPGPSFSTFFSTTTARQSKSPTMASFITVYTKY